MCLDDFAVWAQECKRLAEELMTMEKEASETEEPGFRFLLVLVALGFRPPARFAFSPSSAVLSWYSS